MLRKTRKFVGWIGFAIALGWMGYIQFTHIDDSELRLLVDHWPAYLGIFAIAGVSYSMLLPTRKERMERSQAISDELRAGAKRIEEEVDAEFERKRKR